MKTPAIIGILVVAVLLFLVSCGAPSDRELVLGTLRDLAHHAEKRDTDDILKQIAGDYQDFEGRDKDATRGLLNEYFARYRGIVINILRSQIDDISSTDAEVQCDLAFSSGAAKVFRKFAQISLDNYRLKVRMRKSGDDWLMTYAEWREIGPGELPAGPEK